MTGPDPRRHLPRQDRLLGQPEDQEDQQGQNHPAPQDHARLPLRRKRHDLQLHRLPLERQQGVQEQGRQCDPGRLPDRVGARGSSGVTSTVKQTAGGVTYVDVAYSLKNHFKFFRIQNKAKKFTTPGIRVDPVGGVAGQEGAAEQRAAHRQPAGDQEVRERLSDLHLHLGDRAEVDRARIRRQVVHQVGCDEGTERSTAR